MKFLTTFFKNTSFLLNSNAQIYEFHDVIFSKKLIYFCTINIFKNVKRCVYVCEINNQYMFYIMVNS